jgi:regulation of enolase protein 1 (concanavalin A-like superfamily)
VKFSQLTLLLIFLSVTSARADEVLFQDDFKGRLGEGWSWIREHREAWRATERGLAVLIEPGNMWGPANDARNLLVRPAPDVSTKEIEISVLFETHPTNQYEQADLVWYYDDSNMVKIGRELVDGKVSVVMGREQNDKTRTLAIIPIRSDSVRLKLLVKAGRIRGEFETPEMPAWKQAGECDLPQPANATARLSLQFYQGPADPTHWARATEFRVRRTDAFKEKRP